MSSLRERLEAKGLGQSILTIRGERFLVRELPKGERAVVIARNRDSKGTVLPSLESELLSLCVQDAETGEAVYSVEEGDKWNALGSGFTSHLVAELMTLNGLDNDDVGREVKKSEAAESLG